MARIYISSTYSDLVEHREQVYDILRKMRYDVIAMEDYVATDKRPLDKCLADVTSCDIYVGIFAWRYGYIPPGQERSVTELEYRQAGESELERLIFLLDEDAPWPHSRMEKDTGRAKIEALRGELMVAHLVQFFMSPEELAGQVVVSVAKWVLAQLYAQMKQRRARQAQADKQRREMRDRQRVVNLCPLDVTHTFRDRLGEVRALCDYLADASVRLVSVVGRGGMGKTALASRVLADLERGKLPVPGEERDLPIDGILYLSARSTGLGLERIYADVGRMLGEPVTSKLAARWADMDTSLAAKVEYLLETMRDGLYLILLDNLEGELIEDGAIAEEGLRLFVKRCLTQPGGARLIVTSREEVRLAAATLHSARCIPLRAGLPEDEAVALLRDLDPQGKLSLRDAPEEDLRRAAKLTRGIPRALEILAGILHQDPTISLPRLLVYEATLGAEVVERLVAEGYRRLGDDERRVMEALAVFDRPMDETAVAYLLHPWFPGLNVRACLRRLVSGYFVGANRITGEYSLHPLDRDYTYHQIPEEIGEGYNRRNLELRAASFYSSIRKLESEWKTIDDLAPQLAEFEHRVSAEDCDGAYWVLDSIDSDYLSLWGHYGRLAELREKLLEQLTTPGLRTYNRGRLGSAYRALGQAKRAINHYEEALVSAREIGDRRAEGIGLGNLGSAYRALGQGKQAIKLYGQALVIARKIGDRRGEGVNLGRLGSAYRARGQVKRAIKFHEEALAIAREIGDRRGEGMDLSNLGRAYYDLEQVERAIGYYEEVLAIAREIGDRKSEGINLDNLGRAYYALGQVERAIGYYKEALTITREIGDRRAERVTLGNLHSAYRALGQAKRAINHYEEALVIAREMGDHKLEGVSLGDLGKAYRAQGQIEQAIGYYEQALAIACDIGDRRGERFVLGDLGKAYRAQGQIERAIDYYEKALAIAREIGDRRHEEVSLGDLGSAYRDLGQAERAISYYEQALTIACEISDRWGEGICLGNLGAAYHALGQFERAIEFHEQSLSIARETSGRRGESYPLLGLGRALLATEELFEARHLCAKARDLDEPQTSYQVALAFGIILLRQRDPAAGDAFADAATCCQARLDRTVGLYKERYAMATALVGSAVCDPRWAEEGERAELLAPALADYRRALENCAALGIVRDALRDLELIRAAGVDGLEPAFELLEGYITEKEETQ